MVNGVPIPQWKLFIVRLVSAVRPFSVIVHLRGRLILIPYNQTFSNMS